ncbi:hypothetical protein EG340_06825 [Chryseobacterium indoltheticum]|uniref:Uncharacterized protein n=1 Tax=Chryseobacterium indoltheticum TaxID=254 RepID=A0A3G6N771_9FLAO|nr:hypothetical protein EG340_06825 [Chryseobacterium indoltheticum]
MVSFTKEGKTEVERVKVDSVKEIIRKDETKKITDQAVKKQVEDFSGDIIIKGKADSLTPLVYHNVVGKDTLQSILIKGNADFTISNHYKKAEEKTEGSKKEESTNFIQDLAKTAVSKETIKDVASAVSTKTNDITSTGFQAGTWIVITIVVTFLIFIFFVYKYFKK